MVLEHKQSCIDAFAAFEKQVQEWEVKWPNYCKSCGAAGFLQSPGDMVPYGSTYVPLPDMIEPCNECSENGWCGRCGEKLFDPEEFDFETRIICPKCYWTDDPDVQLHQKDLIHPRINSHPTGEGPCECEEEFVAAAEEEYRQIAHDSFGDLLDRHL